jgi:hypothetical protein
MPNKPSKWAPDGFGRPGSPTVEWAVLAFFLGSPTTLNFHAASTRKGHLKPKTMGTLSIKSVLQAWGAILAGVESRPFH